MSFIGSHYMRENYGLDANPSEADRLNYCKALLIIAGGDGKISKEEWEYFEHAVRASGATDAHIEQYRKFEWRTASLEEVLSGMSNIMTPNALRRALVYDALKIAKADHVFTPGERAAALKAAQILGIDKTCFEAIEGLVNVEIALKTARIAVLNA